MEEIAYKKPKDIKFDASKKNEEYDDKIEKLKEDKRRRNEKIDRMKRT